MTPAVDTVEALDEYRAHQLEPLAWAALSLADTAKHAYARERSLRQAKELRQADERAGLVTARHFSREALQAMAGLALIANGGMPQDCDELADFFGWFQDTASPFASAAQWRGGE